MNDLKQEKDENILEIEKALSLKSEFMSKHYSGVVERMKGLFKTLNKRGHEFDLTFAGI